MTNLISGAIEAAKSCLNNSLADLQTIQNYFGRHIHIVSEGRSVENIRSQMQEGKKASLATLRLVARACIALFSAFAIGAAFAGNASGLLFFAGLAYFAFSLSKAAHMTHVRDTPREAIYNLHVSILALESVFLRTIGL